MLCSPLNDWYKYIYLLLVSQDACQHCSAIVPTQPNQHNPA